ncbi:hypothetical protein [Geminisphaera colitermitum]|uniref:hypothetical protein n=1 Tax=Geminisphaera colitermitum TaxID=1148786 RepID=UPI0012FE9A76|nr:hypothetical protein [Geminisphaera colitermitum]
MDANHYKSKDSFSKTCLVFGISLAVGYLLFRIVAIYIPSIREEWNVGAAIIGLICAGTLFGGIFSFIYNREREGSRNIASPIFLGFIAPWVFRVPSAIWEFLRGGGI